MTEKQIITKRAKQHTVYRNIKGIRLSGVTTILSVIAKPFLIKWANNLGLEGIDSNKYVDILAGIGTLTHAMVHHDLGGIAPNFDEYSKEDIELANNAYSKYKQWKNNNTFNVIGTEMQCISEKYQFGGTCDLLVEMNGLTLIDIKTSKAIYSENFTQVAGYGIALKEMGYNIKKYMILRIGRNANEGLDYLSVPNIDLHRKRFLVCKKLYELNKQIKK